MTTFTVGTTSGVTVQEIAPNAGKKYIEIYVPSTFVWGTDSIAIDLSGYGMTKVTAWLAFEETTAGSIVIAATGTTSVTTTTLTYVSTGSSANTCGGTLMVWGK